MPSEIQNPRRILAVALTSSQDHLSSVIGKLTGSYPSGPFAGATHDLTLDTPYYRAQVPVWLDLVGEEAEAEAEAEVEVEEKDDKKTEKSPYDSDDDDDDPVQAWADAFLADEASEVREALGGIVAVVDASDYKQQRSLVNHVGRLARGCAPAEKGYDDDDDGDDEKYKEEAIQGLSSWDGVGLVVGVSTAPLSDDALLVWDDLCVEAGLEFVLVAPGQADVNEWGEKTGVERVLEALKANDWQGGDAPDPFGEFQGGDDFLNLGADDRNDDDDDDDDDDSSVSLDFGYDKADFEGLRQAIWQQQTKEVEDEADPKDKIGGAEDKDEKEKDEEKDEEKEEDVVVAQLIQKLQAARMQGELLPPAQRRAMAARVVGEVMKDI